MISDVHFPKLRLAQFGASFFENYLACGVHRAYIKSSLFSTNALQPKQTNRQNQPQPQSNMMADKCNDNFANIVSKLGAMPTTVPNYAKLRNAKRIKRQNEKMS